jgi:hypothetical protein
MERLKLDERDAYQEHYISKKNLYKESTLMMTLSRDLNTYGLFHLNIVSRLISKSFTQKTETKNDLGRDLAPFDTSLDEEVDFVAKYLDDEEDVDMVLPPGELLSTTSKLVRIKDEISTVLAELDAVNLLSWNLIRNPRTEMHGLILEQTKKGLHDEITELYRKKAKHESHEHREAIIPGML